MKTKTKYIFLTLLTAFSLSFTSCEELFDPENSENADIAQGLKEALRVGTDTAVSHVAALNGFYQDAAVKILLPNEVERVITKLNSTTAGKYIYETALKTSVDNLVMSINRSAEDAAVKAKPIFVNAISEMTISDAVDILYGTDTAATHYLKANTFNELTDAFAPDINVSLDKKLVANQSANTIWNTFVSTYNTTAKSPLNYALNLEVIDETNLSEYVTHKALDGVFHKVGEEEKHIRKDPVARVTDILQQVFSKLD